MIPLQIDRGGGGYAAAVVGWVTPENPAQNKKRLIYSEIS